jgi:hypothetical protein
VLHWILCYSLPLFEQALHWDSIELRLWGYLVQYTFFCTSYVVDLDDCDGIEAIYKQWCVTG